MAPSGLLAVIVFVVLLLFVLVVDYRTNTTNIQPTPTPMHLLESHGFARSSLTMQPQPHSRQANSRALLNSAYVKTATPTQITFSGPGSDGNFAQTFSPNQYSTTYIVVSGSNYTNGTLSSSDTSIVFNNPSNIAVGTGSVSFTTSPAAYYAATFTQATSPVTFTATVSNEYGQQDSKTATVEGIVLSTVVATMGIVSPFLYLQNAIESNASSLSLAISYSGGASPSTSVSLADSSLTTKVPVTAVANTPDTFAVGPLTGDLSARPYVVNVVCSVNDSSSTASYVIPLLPGLLQAVSFNGNPGTPISSTVPLTYSTGSVVQASVNLFIPINHGQPQTISITGCNLVAYETNGTSQTFPTDSFPSSWTDQNNSLTFSTFTIAANTPFVSFALQFSYNSTLNGVTTAVETTSIAQPFTVQQLSVQSASFPQMFPQQSGASTASDTLTIGYGQDMTFTLSFNAAPAGNQSIVVTYSIAGTTTVQGTATNPASWAVQNNSVTIPWNASMATFVGDQTAKITITVTGLTTTYTSPAFPFVVYNSLENFSASALQLYVSSIGGPFPLSTGLDFSTFQNASNVAGQTFVYMYLLGNVNNIAVDTNNVEVSVTNSQTSASIDSYIVSWNYYWTGFSNLPNVAFVIPLKLTYPSGVKYTYTATLNGSPILNGVNSVPVTASTTISYTNAVQPYATPTEYGRFESSSSTDALVNSLLQQSPITVSTAKGTEIVGYLMTTGPSEFFNYLQDGNAVNKVGFSIFASIVSAATNGKLAATSQSIRTVLSAEVNYSLGLITNRKTSITFLIYDFTSANMLAYETTSTPIIIQR